MNREERVKEILRNSVCSYVREYDDDFAATEHLDLRKLALYLADLEEKIEKLEHPLVVKDFNELPRKEYGHIKK